MSRIEGVQVYALADKSSLSGIRKLIRARLNEVEAPASHSFDCLVAVTEACTNALVHGKGEADVPDPQVEWEIDRSAARFLIRDFAAQDASKSVEAIPEKEERDGGYGLKMMRQLMDEVDVDFGPKGTRVRLVKYLEAQAAHH